ncbi:UPF0481 protein [Actinidia chinensis var. chinensis]|uniref:UPF0481 protein n=1 Tax=Actinidia chinensis var. chinensis TaxID=1590841 RepID=A0A2R6R8M3_ACTCC|nr:UPF0481 protein [Actinidia chinensis var. chinensis]
MVLETINRLEGLDQTWKEKKNGRGKDQQEEDQISANYDGQRKHHQHEESTSRANDVGQLNPTRLGNIQQNIIQGINCLFTLPKEPCIFKVHQGLRHINPDAYTPVLVSIGPYHHGNCKYLPMEQHKIRYLESLLKRSDKKGMLEYLEAMMELEAGAHDCYSDPFYLAGGADNFVQMMLLDACFVIEFLRKCYLPELRDKDDPIFATSWIKIQICRDLMLLENQLPFFVLLQLFNMSETSSNPGPEFAKLAETPLRQVLPKDDYFPSPSSNCESSKHFLDLVHNIFSRDQAYPNQISIPINCGKMPCVMELEEAGVKCQAVKKGKEISIPINCGTCVKMPCVMELEEAGVKFQAVKKGKEISIFEINFEDGVLKIPEFEVSDLTEIFLRNIIAYEQHIGNDHKTKYFTDFTSFVDALINTKEDVTKLCGHQIITNLLGDDEEVACMFNKLGQGKILEPSSFYYSQVCQKLNDHCQKRWNKARAKLMRDYFNTPWASVSTSAAIFLLLLTLAQTLASLIPLFV